METLLILDTFLKFSSSVTLLVT
uniref:Uncharacterized protein n=1 Tax=Anguilla anguilla TaxID=7936 RepID=A0A0E9SC83_ANGAN